MKILQKINRSITNNIIEYSCESISIINNNYNFLDIYNEFGTKNSNVDLLNCDYSNAIKFNFIVDKFELKKTLNDNIFLLLTINIIRCDKIIYKINILKCTDDYYKVIFVDFFFIISPPNEYNFVCDQQDELILLINKLINKIYNSQLHKIEIHISC